MELSQQQLEQLKQTELELLRHFMDVCNQLGLTCYVLGGTMLGAVRHQGFIPWDDDIDVGMLRKDYEILLEKGQALLPKGLFLQTFETDPQYPANFAKLRNSYTTFVESSVQNRDMNHGVYIDIFPLDYYPDRRQRWFAMKKELLSLRISTTFTVGGMKPTTKLVRLFTRLLYPTVRGALRKRERLFRSVTEGKRIANHCGAWGAKEIVPAQWYGKGTPMAFENLTVTVPKDYHSWLTQVYGDYMQLPPEEKRIPHHFAADFDLNRPQGERYIG